MKSDKAKIEFFEELGKTKLPEKFKEQVITIFNRYDDKWFTAEMFGEGLDMSKAYAFRICEALTITRVVERSKVGQRCFYRYRKEDRLGRS